MQFIDLKTQQKRIRQDIEKRILNVLDHGRYIMGPEIKELEKRLANIENKSNEFLFLQNDIYSYKLIYEYSIVAFYLGITNIVPETIHILSFSSIN